MSLLKKKKMVPFFASNGNSEKVRAPYGIQPTTLCDLVGCSNHWATGNSMASKVERVMFFFFKRLTWWLDSWIYDMPLCDCMIQLWAIRACPGLTMWLLLIEYPVAQWLEHPTRPGRVVGSNAIWFSDFFRFSIWCKKRIMFYSTTPNYY